jgi:hypothetical protein
MARSSTYRSFRGEAVRDPRLTEKWDGEVVMLWWRHLTRGRSVSIGWSRRVTTLNERRWKET